jgi:hypothetical protein
MIVAGVVLVGIVGATGLLILSQSNRGEGTAVAVGPAEQLHRVRRLAPARVSGLLAEAHARLDAAKAAFRDARAESERALVSQLQEAKQRGSVPPV